MFYTGKSILLILHMKQKKELRSISVESDIILKHLYSLDFRISDETGQPIQIEPQGTIGLLCSGYKGVIAMRKIRETCNYKSKNTFITDSNKANHE